MRISDWSSDVCSSDLRPSSGERKRRGLRFPGGGARSAGGCALSRHRHAMGRGQLSPQEWKRLLRLDRRALMATLGAAMTAPKALAASPAGVVKPPRLRPGDKVGLIEPRSEEHTS